jgi:hypothetical protein
MATMIASMSTSTPRATSTPLPSVDELRERAAATATAASGYVATVVAERRATVVAYPTATPFRRAEVEVAGARVQPTGTARTTAAGTTAAVQPATPTSVRRP